MGRKYRRITGEPNWRNIINLYVIHSPKGTLEKLAGISDGFGGSDPEGAVRAVAIQAVIHGDSVADDALFEKCFRNMVQLSKTAPEKIEVILIRGRERAVPVQVALYASPNDRFSGKRSVIINRIEERVNLYPFRPFAVQL